jgi:endonuclease/exonuclease/phosphatase family metal-dependent hydrolase
VRIISLNAWGGACWPALSAWLPGCGADVLCLQEVIRPVAPGTPGWLRYVDPYRDLAQRGDLLGDIDDLWPGAPGWFTPAARGPLTDAQGRVWQTDHGLAVWTGAGVNVTSRLDGYVHGSFRADGWGPEPVPRAIQVLRINSGGRTMTIAHFHGLRDPAGKADTPARAAQTAAVFAALNRIRQPGDLTVLAGDFNLRPDSTFFDRARAEGLIDLVTTRGHADTRTALYPKPERFADYLLLSDPAALRAFVLPAEPLLSDHRPLILDLA